MGYARTIILLLLSSLSVVAQPLTPSELAWPNKPYPQGLAGWLMADRGVYSDSGTTLALDGERIQQWNDQSGNSNHVSAAAPGGRPFYSTGQLNGLPIIKWYGTNGLLGLFPVQIPSTFSGVMRFTSTNADSNVLFGLGAPGIFVSYRTNGIISFIGGDLLGIETSMSTSQWHIVTCVINGSGSFLRVDGVAIASANIDTASISSITVGCTSCSGASPEYDIAEIVWIRGIHGILYTENYLRKKWGL